MNEVLADKQKLLIEALANGDDKNIGQILDSGETLQERYFSQYRDAMGNYGARQEKLCLEMLNMYFTKKAVK